MITSFKTSSFIVVWWCYLCWFSLLSIILSFPYCPLLAVAFAVLELEVLPYIVVMIAVLWL